MTGGAGYLGSRVVAHLLARGHKVRVFDRLLYGGEALLALGAFPNLTVEAGDIRDQAALRHAMAMADAVIHLAGIVGEDACQCDPAFSWSVNHDAVPGLIRGAEEAKIARIVAISTCSNYGVAEPNVEVGEDAPLNPLSAYARAKIATERMLLEADRLPCVTVLRLGTICGLSARMRFDLLVNEMARDAAFGREIEIYAPAAWRPFLHIADAAEAMERVLTADAGAVNRAIFNVVGENRQKTGLLDIARTLFPELRAKIVDRRPDLRDYRVSGQRFTDRLGFRPSVTVADAFGEVAAAVRDGRFRDPDWKGHSAVPFGGFPATGRPTAA
ncbi:MAG: NAD-dependent epimerase/dehydratase family protein [Acetobacteraceae bacterium]